MEVLIVLGVALVGFRLAGRLGVRRFEGWAVCAAHGMAVVLVMTGSLHFAPDSVTAVPNHADFVPMVPPAVPFPSAMVYLSGVLELLGAVGLVVAGTRWVAGAGLALLYVLLLPANIYAAVADVPFDGAVATPLWVRIPEQVVYIGVAVWVAGTADTGLVRWVLAAVRREAVEA